MTKSSEPQGGCADSGSSPNHAYRRFFKHLTGHAPFSYQERLAAEPWPEVIDVPTGLGKTAAVIGAWLYRVANADPDTGRRLIYCLPMRVLVNQTADVARLLCERAATTFSSRGVALPSVHPMLGGFVDEDWEAHPERPVILVGTQEMLLSRALARGYAMSRYKWPIHFGLFHSDTLWVLDETQLMGVAVETTSQLEGLRRIGGIFGPARTIWMSATLARVQLETIDHAKPECGFRMLMLGDDDRASRAVQMRTAAHKALEPVPVRICAGKEIDQYAVAIASAIAEAHEQRGGLTLVVLNRVDRAQAIYRALSKLGVAPLGLVHSRFRTPDRAHHELLLHGKGDRVLVATQAIEAGVDVSARTLFTELAPWPSLVQRFGRCNRFGEEAGARVLWVDLDVEANELLALPYECKDLAEARRLLRALDDVGPDSVARVPYSPSSVVRPVLRRRDLIDLFDTSADLLGNDVDISRFIRDETDTDVSVYYRDFEGLPEPDAPAPTREEFVSVSVGAARAFIERLRKKRASLGDSERDRDRKRLLRAWTWNPLAGTPWSVATSVYPGQVLLLNTRSGGYEAELGWTGEVLTTSPVAPISPDLGGPSLRELMDSDPRTAVGRWVTLQEHLADVEDEAAKLVASLELPDRFRRAVVTAGRWHDLGKVHAEFQRRLVEPVQEDPERRAPHAGPWAKSNHSLRAPRGVRPYFRHELASALAWLQLSPDHVDANLIAYLIAAHHGKVRVSIRSLPDEVQPPEPERLFARGVWDGDELPAAEMPGGTVVGPVVLDLSPIQIGQGSWLERTLELRDDPEVGPFRLAYLEALVRIADWRASAKERRDA